MPNVKGLVESGVTALFSTVPKTIQRVEKVGVRSIDSLKAGSEVSKMVPAELKRGSEPGAGEFLIASIVFETLPHSRIFERFYA